MKRYRQVIFTSLLILLTPIVAAQTTKHARGSTERDFRRLIDRYYASWNALNADSASQYYAKDSGLVFYDNAPLKYTGWEEYKNGVTVGFFDKVSSCKLTPNNDLKISRHGDVVWTTLTFHLSALFKAGTPLEIECRHTAIWERRGKKWLIVHEHVSVPISG